MTNESIKRTWEGIKSVPEFKQQFVDTVWRSLVKGWRDIPRKEEYKNYYSKDISTFDPETNKEVLLSLLRKCVDSLLKAKGHKCPFVNGHFRLTVTAVGLSGSGTDIIYIVDGFLFRNKNSPTGFDIISCLDSRVDYTFVAWCQLKTPVRIEAIRMKDNPLYPHTFLVKEKHWLSSPPGEEYLPRAEKTCTSLYKLLKNEVKKRVPCLALRTDAQVAIFNEVILIREDRVIAWVTPFGCISKTNQSSLDFVDAMDRLGNCEEKFMQFFGVLHSKRIDFSDTTFVKKIMKTVMRENTLGD